MTKEEILDLAHSFQTLINFMFVKYEGCLIEKTKDGYKWGKNEFKTLDEAKRHIDNLFKNWKIN